MGCIGPQHYSISYILVAFPILKKFFYFPNICFTCKDRCTVYFGMLINQPMKITVHSLFIKWVMLYLRNYSSCLDQMYSVYIYIYGTHIYEQVTFELINNLHAP